MRSRLSLATAALALSAALLSACAGARPAPATPSAAPAAGRKAFLWEITRLDAPDRPLYLTGSMHLGKAGGFAFPPSLSAALERAQALVVEVDPSRTSEAEMQRFVLQSGFYPPPQSLSAHLDEPTRARLAEAVARAGLPLPGVDRMRPWLVAATLEVMELERGGFDSEHGLDAQLLDRARGRKRIVELETTEEQLRMLSGLPEDVQVRMLTEQLQEGETVADATGIAEAWDAGDAAAMDAIVFRYAGDPGLAPMYEAVLWARNRTMAEKLAALAGAPEIHLAVVGAGHLVGDRGLLALLAARGLRVRQLAWE